VDIRQCLKRQYRCQQPQAPNQCFFTLHKTS